MKDGGREVLSVAPTSLGDVSSGEPYDTERILTLPNVLSFVRLLGVPLFLFLLGRQPDCVSPGKIISESLQEFP